MVIAGLRAVYCLVDRTSDRASALSIRESREAMEAAEQRGGDRRIQAVRNFGGSLVSVDGNLRRLRLLSSTEPDGQGAPEHGDGDDDDADIRSAHVFLFCLLQQVWVQQPIGKYAAMACPRGAGRGGAIRWRIRIVGRTEELDAVRRLKLA